MGERFENQDMAETVFYSVNLHKAVFDDVNLGGATFGNVNLGGAVIRDASLANLSIESAHIVGLTIDGIRVDELIEKELPKNKDNSCKKSTENQLFGLEFHRHSQTSLFEPWN